VEKYCRSGQATDGNIAHARCMLDTTVYKHSLRICNTYCFSTATIVALRHLNVMLCYTYIACLAYELPAFSTQITLQQRVFKCNTRLKSMFYIERCYYESFRRMLPCAPFLNTTINIYLRSCHIQVLFYSHVIQVPTPPMPPHVLMNFRGFPPGCGDSVADF